MSLLGAIGMYKISVYVFIYLSNIYYVICMHKQNITIFKNYGKIIISTLMTLKVYQVRKIYLGNSEKKILNQMW